MDWGHLIPPGKREANLPNPGTRRVEDIPQEHSITTTPINYYDWFEIVMP